MPVKSNADLQHSARCRYTHRLCATGRFTTTNNYMQIIHWAYSMNTEHDNWIKSQGEMISHIYLFSHGASDYQWEIVPRCKESLALRTHDKLG